MSGHLKVLYYIKDCKIRTVTNKFSYERCSIRIPNINGILVAFEIILEFLHNLLLLVLSVDSSR
jgi:hypothetical protein